MLCSRPRFLRGAWELLGDCLALNTASKGFWCPEHISARKSPGSKRMSVFFGVFYWFSGMAENRVWSQTQYIVLATIADTFRGMGSATEI
jgi:hypothetical protein